VEEAERSASGEYSAPRGDLTITAPIVFGRVHVLPIVVEFLAAYRQIGVRIMLADRVANLLEEDVDLAVRIGELPDSSLVATRVGSVRRVICGSPAYFAERGIPTSPSELGNHDCITFEGLTSPRAWTFTKGRSEVSEGLGRQAELLRAGIRTFGGALIGVTTVGGLAALVDRSISAADAIGKTADKIGVGVEELQELGFAAKASGVEQQTFGKYPGLVGFHLATIAIYGVLLIRARPRSLGSRRQTGDWL
jgi:DNA-binding transcriptional LysR family regulator